MKIVIEKERFKLVIESESYITDSTIKLLKKLINSLEKWQHCTNTVTTARQKEILILQLWHVKFVIELVKHTILNHHEKKS